MGAKVNFCAGVFIFLSILVAFNENYIHNQQKLYSAHEPQYLDYKWSDIAKNIPRCYRPIVMRNAFSFPNDCKSKDDLCDSFMRQRFVDYFGDKTIATFPPSHVTYTDNRTSQPDIEYIKFRDYLTNPKYKNYVIHSLHQLGSHEQYELFFNFENREANSFKRFVDVNHGEIYAGTQFFFGNGKNTGSNLHYATALTVSTQLSGRKRWLLISPYYFDSINCKPGKQGLYGQCFPNNYTHSFGDVSIDRFKNIILNEVGVPKEYVVDIILHPGDILLNCEYWMHVVENLDEQTSANSIRYAVDLPKDIYSIKGWNILLRNLWEGIKTKYHEPELFTLVDAFYETVIKRTKSLTDVDPRFKLTSVMNQKSKTT